MKNFTISIDAPPPPTKVMYLADVEIGTVFHCDLPGDVFLMMWHSNDIGQQIVCLDDPKNGVWDHPRLRIENFQELEGELTVRPKR